MNQNKYDMSIYKERMERWRGAGKGGGARGGGGKKGKGSDRD